MNRVRIPKTEAEEIWNESPFHQYSRVNRINLKRELVNLKKSVKKDVESHLSIHLEILDECIRVLIHIERLKPKDPPHWEFWVFKMLISRIRSLFIAFIELTFVGQTDPTRLIARSAMESFELAVACITNPKFCAGFANKEEVAEDDDRKFWNKNIAYGKIYDYYKPGLSRFMILPEPELTNHIEWRKEWKSALSSSVHSAFGIAFQCTATPSLANPGHYAIDQIGHLNEHAPALFALMISEAHILGSFVMNITISKDRPNEWPAFKPPEVTDLMAACFVLNSIYLKYEQVFEDDSKRLFELHHKAQDESDNDTV